jgi:CheY-like chemotaxis protein
MAVNKSFLIVDDSSTMRQLIVMTLKKLGCTSIIDAPNGAVALQKLQSNPVDVVLTDIDMPEMNGLEFIERARPLFADLPIIILSTHGNDAMRDKGLALGANYYLTKPLSGMAVTDVLEQIFPDLDL